MLIKLFLVCCITLYFCYIDFSCECSVITSCKWTVGLQSQGTKLFCISSVLHHRCHYHAWLSHGTSLY